MNEEKAKEDSSKKQKEAGLQTDCNPRRTAIAITFFEQLTSTKSGEDAVDNLKMKIVKGNHSTNSKSYRKAQNKKYNASETTGGEGRKSETPKERRARLKRDI